MRRVVRHRLLLVAVVLVLAAASLWQWRHDRAGASGTLLKLAPDAVTRIDVEVPGAPVRHYVRRDGHWWRQGDPPRRVNDALLVHVAAVAGAPVLHWRPRHAFDPSLIGLQPPKLVVTLNGRRLAFGTLAATGPMRYVRVGGRLALIPAVDTPQPPSRDKVHSLSAENGAKGASH